MNGQLINLSSKKHLSKMQKRPKQRKSNLKCKNSGQISKIIKTCTCSSITENQRETNNNLFPPYFHWVVFVLLLGFRINYVIDKNNWWILHPDEIYQTLEIAHSEIYGYGFRPYEYLPPPDIYEPNTTAASIHQYNLGMYSLRSCLVPKVFVCVGYIAVYCGYTGSLFIVWKVFHASVSSLLVLPIYKFVRNISGCHDTAVLSSVLCTSSLHLNILGTHTLINSFLSPFVYLVLALITDHTTCKTTNSSDHDGCCHGLNGDRAEYEIVDYNCNLKTIKALKCPKEARNRIPNDNLKDFFCGFLCVLLIYIRPDVSVIIVAVVLSRINMIKWTNHSYLNICCGAVVAIYIGILDDFKSYGSIVISPWQWIKFNVIGTSATRLILFEESLFYVRVLFLEHYFNFGLLVISVILICIFVGNNLIFKTGSFLTSQKATIQMGTMFKLCAMSTLIILLYSSKSHKEVRFIHDIIPFFFTIFSRAMIIIINEFGLKKCWFRVIFYCSLLYCVSNQLISFLHLDKNAISKWTYEGIHNSNDVNVCLDFIGRQENVTGLFLDSNIYMTGGYTLLMKNIPMLVRIDNEYFEFGTDARKVVPSIVSSNTNVSVFTFSRITDFILRTNFNYLSKKLISSPYLNYCLVRTNITIADQTHVEIFRNGGMRVLRRQNVLQIHRDLEFKIEPVRNTRFLNIEADWLIYYGVYERAKERLKQALKINSTDLTSFQLLIQTHHMMGENKLTRKTLHHCSTLHDRNVCLQVPKRNKHTNK